MPTGKVINCIMLCLRNEPTDEDLNVIELLNPDDQVTYKKTSDPEWLEVNYNGQTGFCKAGYIKATRKRTPKKEN